MLTFHFGLSHTGSERKTGRTSSVHQKFTSRSTTQYDAKLGHTCVSSSQKGTSRCVCDLWVNKIFAVFSFVSRFTIFPIRWVVTAPQVLNRKGDKCLLRALCLGMETCGYYCLPCTVQRRRVERPKYPRIVGLLRTPPSTISRALFRFVSGAA
jgi:hypothetical protein